jgi:hypothetical protein
MEMKDTAEYRRLAEHRNREGGCWKQWGPYLSERAWATVREDYGVESSPWRFFPHEHARSKAYRWNEDGIAGICDCYQRLCFALTLWNGKDRILKERLFGLTGPEGNHGEDVKEVYYYLDSTPTHSYMKAMVRYPQAEFPYEQLVATAKARGLVDPEYELVDTGVFDGNRFFDVYVSYAKNDARDILIKIEVINHAPEEASLHLLPTLWFRNTWSWDALPHKPVLKEIEGPPGTRSVEARIDDREVYVWYAEDAKEVLFTENETNRELLEKKPNASRYVKDAFHRFLIAKEADAVNPARLGTKSAALYHLTIPASGRRTIRLRLSDIPLALPFDSSFEQTFEARHAESTQFFLSLRNPSVSEDERNILYQALAGMMWSKQFYNYDVAKWLKGDAVHRVPEGRKPRNADWTHLVNYDVISMPDKWEYPWYAVWDLAFHAVAISLVDIDFAKRQLTLFTRESYMHPNGQLPAYEWSFDHANPPVHPWAVWRVYQMEKEFWGSTDRYFLESLFHKLLLNFTWWVNRKDYLGNNIFHGGFLGLDNIGIFDRSRQPPMGGRIDQSDGTSWMAAYCVQMMRIALELARDNDVYEELAARFLEHFLRIAHAMTTSGRSKTGLWNEGDGFFYDSLHLPDDRVVQLKIRSLVGLVPLFAVDTIEASELERYPKFRRRMEWLLENRPELTANVASFRAEGSGQKRLVALLAPERLKRVLTRMLDEEEFLSPYGIRSVSRSHLEKPFTFEADGVKHSVSYDPAESRVQMFGGNSNWRGPIWFPMNYLIIDSLRRFHKFYGDGLKIPFPAGSDNALSLETIAHELSRRLIRLFLKDESGNRPAFASLGKFQNDPKWTELMIFPEYFHGDTGAGLGAIHQTGWTGLVANLIQETAGRS